MSENNPNSENSDRTGELDRPFFTAVLTPHRSLGPNGFMILMLCFGAVSFVAGILFWSIGAWPVFGFFGLDIALLWLAFRMNYKSARTHEEVIVSRNELIIQKGRTRQDATRSSDSIPSGFGFQSTGSRMRASSRSR